MAHIIRHEYRRIKTQIRCSNEERKFLENMLGRVKRYKMTSLLGGEGDYMIGSVNNAEYCGNVVTVVSVDIKRHEKLVDKIENLLVNNKYDTRSEIRIEYVG